MTKIEILDLIKNFDNNYTPPKTSGRDNMVTHLVHYISRLSPVKQTEIKMFLLKLRLNKSNYRYVAVATLTKLNDKTMIPQIYDIFHQMYLTENYQIIKGPYSSTSIFLLLMHMKDKEEKHLVIYSKYVDEVLKIMFLIIFQLLFPI
ncbi:MAG: hypothetical protein LBR17_00835 [Bacteroidales bacterium]|jgi:hypothetical protein|nr:hypothetical protein [Bacteroidales bacterium]